MSEKRLSKRNFRNLADYEIFDKYGINLTVHDFSVDEHSPLEVTVEEFGGRYHVSISSPPVMDFAAFIVTNDGELMYEDGYYDPFFTVEKDGQTIGIVRSDLKFELD